MDNKEKIYRVYGGPILILAAFEVLIFKTEWFLYLVPLIALIYFAALFLAGFKKLKKQTFIFGITPFLFLVGIILFLTYQEGSLIKHFMVILAGFGLAVFFENLYTFAFYPQKYQSNSLENIFGYLNIINIFLFYTSFNAFIVLLSYPVWVLILISLVINSIIFHQIFWINNITTKYFSIFVLVFNLILVEIFWSLQFLPTNIYLNGLAITVTYYLYLNLVKASVLNILTQKLVIRYLVVGLVTLALVLITAPW